MKKFVEVLIHPDVYQAIKDIAKEENIHDQIRGNDCNAVIEHLLRFYITKTNFDV